MSVLIWIVLAIIAGVIAEEAIGWITPLCLSMLDRAARRLPSSWQERYAEEWRAELAVQPGGVITKLIWTTRVYLGSKSLAAELVQPEGLASDTVRPPELPVIQLETRLPKSKLSTPDDELIESLRKAGFQGAQYEQFESELARYGWAVMNAWLRTGRIFNLARAARRGVHPSGFELDTLRNSAEEREDLAAAVVGFSITKFRSDALLGGGWRPGKGQSIRSYFSGHLVHEFPNHFRAWQRQHSRYEQARLAVVTLGDGLDPAELATQRMGVLAELASLEPRQREIIALYYDGFSLAEIADFTGLTTVKSVERVIARWRKRAKAIRTTQTDG